MHMTRKMLEYELGRYKKKVEDQGKEIQKLKETIKGHEDAQDGIFAMITAVVQKAGEVTITRDEISEIMEQSLHTLVTYDADARAYTLTMMPGGDTDGGEGNEDSSC